MRLRPNVALNFLVDLILPCPFLQSLEISLAYHDGGLPTPSVYVAIKDIPGDREILKPSSFTGLWLYMWYPSEGSLTATVSTHRRTCEAGLSQPVAAWSVG